MLEQLAEARRLLLAGRARLLVLAQLAAAEDGVVDFLYLLVGARVTTLHLNKVINLRSSTGLVQLLHIVRHVWLRYLESLATLFDAQWVLLALFAEIIRILRRRCEKLMLQIRLFAFPNRINWVLWPVELHLLAIWARLGWPEANEAEAADLAGVLSDAVLFVYVDSVFGGSVLVDAGAVVAHFLSKRVITTHIQLMIPLNIVCTIITVQSEAGVRCVRNRNLRGGTSFLLATRVALILTWIFHGLLLMGRPKVRPTVDNILQNWEEIAIIVDQLKDLFLLVLDRLRSILRILILIQEKNRVLRLIKYLQNLVIPWLAQTLLHKLSGKVTACRRHWILRVEDTILVEGEVLCLLFWLHRSWMISILIMPLQHLVLHYTTLGRDDLLLLS